MHTESLYRVKQDTDDKKTDMTFYKQLDFFPDQQCFRPIMSKQILNDKIQGTDAHCIITWKIKKKRKTAYNNFLQQTCCYSYFFPHVLTFNNEFTTLPFYKMESKSQNVYLLRYGKLWKFNGRNTQFQAENAKKQMIFQ